MAFYLDRIQSLQECISAAFSRYCKADFSSDELLPLKEKIDFFGTSASTSMVDLSADLEIAFRQLLFENADIDDTEGNLLETSPAVQLIRFAFDFAKRFASPTDNIAKIPFILLEDLMEHQNIAQLKRIWQVVESWLDVITNPVLFNKGKLIVLKTCNSLLRKLSKSCHTEFCGRILMFLATIYPLSEQSALNLSGKINTGNVTYYDDMDKFVPLADITNAVAGQPITYDLYQSFWKLQSCFASNTKTLEPQLWSEFMDLAKKTIELFRMFPFAPSSGDNRKGNESTHLSNKYLTSSQLFSLQLNDPLLRQQVAVQLLVFIHFLQVKGLPSVADIPTKNSYAKDLLAIHDLTRDLIQTTLGSQCDDFVEVLKRIMKREEFWISWKSKNCPTFIKNTESESVLGEKRKAEALEGESSQQPSKKATSIKAIDISEQVFDKLKNKRTTMVFDCSDENVQETSTNLSDTCRPLDNFIETFLEAEDPENGIEEEYHPKKSHLFCWRTRRLIAEKDLSLFALMNDGDIGKGIRKLRNLPEPVVVAKPVEEHAMSIDESDDKEKDEEADETKSVGSKGSMDLYDFMEANDADKPPVAAEPEEGEELEE